MKKLIASIKEYIRLSKECGDDFNTKSWGFEEGILLTPSEAELIVKHSWQKVSKKNLPPFDKVNGHRHNASIDVLVYNKAWPQYYFGRYYFDLKMWIVDGVKDSRGVIVEYFKIIESPID